MSRIGETSPDFDGRTYSRAMDQVRLSGQMARVIELMQDGEWRTLAWIANVCGGSEAGVSARLRDARKIKFGGHTVNRRRVKNMDQWEYRMIINDRHRSPS